MIISQITGFTLRLQHPLKGQTGRRNHGTNQTPDGHGVLLHGKGQTLPPVQGGQGESRQEPAKGRGGVFEIDARRQGRSGRRETRGAQADGEGDGDVDRRPGTPATLGGEGAETAGEKEGAKDEAAESEGAVSC